MKYLKCKKNVKEFKKAMEKDLLGIHYILNEHIENENDFSEIMKEISCKEIIAISGWIERKFIRMDSTSKSALILGITRYKRDAYSYKYALLQMAEASDSIMEKGAMIILCSLFGTAALMLQIWSITESLLFLFGGFAILAGLSLPLLFPKMKRANKSGENYTSEKMILREKISSVKYDVALVESEIKHTAYRYWNTSMMLGCRHRS